MNLLLAIPSQLTESHLVLKMLLWVSLIILGVYIFFLEGRVLLTRRRIKKAFKRFSKEEALEVVEEKEEVLELDVKEIKTLSILFLCITIFTTILTFTY